jgi:hypothetical protein
MVSAMEETAELAGFIAAHAIWSVSDGETLIPMLGSEDAAGERKLTRFMTEKLEDGVAQGRKAMADDKRRSGRAAFAFDGYITLADGKTDAVFVEARDHASGQPFVIAIPYRHQKSKGGFAVYKPKLLEVPESGADANALIEAFWRGVDSHEKAAPVWNKHLDQSR